MLNISCAVLTNQLKTISLFLILLFCLTACKYCETAAPAGWHYCWYLAVITNYCLPGQRPYIPTLAGVVPESIETTITLAMSQTSMCLQSSWAHLLYFYYKLSSPPVDPQKSFRDLWLTTESNLEGSDGDLSANAAWSPAACTLLWPICLNWKDVDSQRLS